jgi:hypothetical protein
LDLSGIIVMALVLGGLQIYFLTPFRNGVSNGYHENATLRFSDAIKKSFINTTFHKKAVLAFLLLFFTLIFIRGYYEDLDWYNEAHGVISSIEPTVYAKNYMIAATGYSIIIYIAIVFRRAIKLRRSVRT